MAKYLSIENPKVVESDKAKILRCRQEWETVKDTPKAPKNVAQWARHLGIAWETSKTYLAQFTLEATIDGLAIEIVPDNWIPVDTGYVPLGDTFMGMQDVRDTLQGIANEAMNVVDDCNGTIIAIDAVLTVMQSEARVATLEATVKSLNNRLYLAEDNNVRLHREIEAEKERQRELNISKSSQG